MAATTLKSSWADDVDDGEDLRSFPLPPPRVASSVASKPPSKPAAGRSPLPPRNNRWRQDTPPPPARRDTPPPNPGWTTVNTAKRPPASQPGTPTMAACKWESTAPKPTSEGEPPLFFRSVFLVGVQGFTDQTLHTFLVSSGVPVSLVRILRSHKDGSLKPFALCVTSDRVRDELINTDKRVLINPHLPDNSEIDCRTVIPFEARAHQDPNTVIVKGCLVQIDAMREYVSVLGEPRSVSVQPKCNAVFVEWDNTLAPYMAVELFHGERLEGRVLNVELARA